MSLTSYRAAPPRGIAVFVGLFGPLNANGPLLAACFLAEAVLVLCFEKILVLFLPFADLAATYSPAS